MSKTDDLLDSTQERTLTNGKEGWLNLHLVHTIECLREMMDSDDDDDDDDNDSETDH